MAGLFRNGFLLLIPVFVINIVLYKKLPEFFKPAQWDNIPKYVPIAENIFRYLSFLLPMIMIIGISSLRWNRELGNQDALVVATKSVTFLSN